MQINQDIPRVIATVPSSGIGVRVTSSGPKSFGVQSSSPKLSATISYSRETHTSWVMNSPDVLMNDPIAIMDCRRSLGDRPGIKEIHGDTVS